MINENELNARLYRFTANDDSMSKSQIFKGDDVIFSSQDVQNGDIVAVAVIADKKILMRKINRIGGKIQLIPSSDDPKYKIHEYDTKNNDIQILGRAIYLSKEIK